MSEYKFEGLLDYLCGDIISKAERREVRDELYDHLMTRYETNLACGMTEDEAKDDAIDRLGDVDALKVNLQKIHRDNPLKKITGTFSNIMQLPVLAVVILTGPNKQYFDRYWFFLFAFLTGFIVYEAVKVRKISRLFRVLSAVLIIYSMTVISFEFISLYISSISPVMAETLIAGNILIIVILHFAVYDLLKAHNLETENKRKLAVSVTAASLCLVLYGVLFFCTEIAAYFLILLWSAIIIIGNRYLKSAGEILEKNDVKPDFKTSSFKKTIAVLLTAAVCASSGFIYEYTYFYKPNNKAITALTVNYDLPERKAAEKKLAKYEVPTEFLAVLPDTELSMYGDLKSPENNPLIVPDFKVVSPKHIYYTSDLDLEDENYYIIQLKTNEYAFPLRQEENGVVFRLLRITDFSVPDENYEEFSNAVAGFFDFSNRSSFWKGRGITVDASTETVILADEENGELTYRKPLRKYKGSDSETTGCDFKINRKTFLIYAVNLLVENGDGREIHSYTDYVFKKKPVIYRYRSAREISEKLGNFNYVNNTTVSECRVFYNHELSEIDKRIESRKGN